MNKNKKILFAFLLIIIPVILIFSMLLIFNSKNKNVDYDKLMRLAQEKSGIIGKVSSPGIDLNQYLTTWNFNNLIPLEQQKYYRTYIDDSGRPVREYNIHTENKNIELAPNLFFPAWTFNGQVPGPTIRVTEGDIVKINFTNNSDRPHTMHFHGIHTSEMDGSMPEYFVYPGEKFTYEFIAEPYGIHLYHCHALPLTQHIHKGLYGVYIVDPKIDTRPKPDKELIMLMNGFDTNFDEENEIYALNTVPFYYTAHPIQIKKLELVRIYLVNILEFDPVNSFHVHGNF